MNQTMQSADYPRDRATKKNEKYDKKALSNATTTENSIFMAKDQNQVLTIMQRCFPNHFEKKDSKADTTSSQIRSSKQKVFSKTELDTRRLHDKLFHRNPDFLKSLAQQSDDVVIVSSRGLDQSICDELPIDEQSLQIHKRGQSLNGDFWNQRNMNQQNKTIGKSLKIA